MENKIQSCATIIAINPSKPVITLERVKGIIKEAEEISAPFPEIALELDSDVNCMDAPVETKSVKNANSPAVEAAVPALLTIDFASAMVLQSSGEGRYSLVEQPKIFKYCILN